MFAVLACGGITYNQTANTCEIFDPVTQSWRLTASLIPFSATLPRMVPLPNGQALLVTGTTAVYQSDTDVWSSPIGFVVGPRLSNGLVRL